MKPSEPVCNYEDILEYCGLNSIDKLRSTIAKTEELIAVVDSFDYSSYLKLHLTNVKIELTRQLSLATVRSHVYGGTL
jgi:hypothetical protein